MGTQRELQKKKPPLLPSASQGSIVSVGGPYFPAGQLVQSSAPAWLYCPPAQLEGIPLKFVTIAEELASAGYSTHAIGKWHQGQASDAFTPTRRGFSTFLG